MVEQDMVIQYTWLYSILDQVLSPFLKIDDAVGVGVCVLEDVIQVQHAVLLGVDLPQHLPVPL